MIKKQLWIIFLVTSVTSLIKADKNFYNLLNEIVPVLNQKERDVVCNFLYEQNKLDDDKNFEACFLQIMVSLEKETKQVNPSFELDDVIKGVKDSPSVSMEELEKIINLN